MSFYSEKRSKRAKKRSLVLVPDSGDQSEGIDFTNNNNYNNAIDTIWNIKIFGEDMTKNDDD